MDDLLTISRPALRSRRPELVPAVVIGVLLAAVFVVMALLLRPPDTVDLTVDNPLEWRAEVSVRGAGDDAWTGAGAVTRNGSLEFVELPDQGEEWVLRFRYAGYSEEVRMSRQAIADQGWTVEVPEELARQLQAAGVAPTTDSAAG